MRPAVVIRRGTPDDAELAALLAAVAVLRRKSAPPPGCNRRAGASWTPAGRAYRPPGMWTSG
ncbi:acyl-CoA carboxylase epsilon subunit [Amycolatopsis rifamycinica]|uniref:acyl-CoA carboxylase epsilon subunit n=1 Tax=Amycolatopsis rifamycinica TaxID=287986 RepID=UPI001269D59C